MRFFKAPEVEPPPSTLQMVKNSLLVAGGQITPLLTTFAVDRRKLAEIAANLSQIIDLGDFLFLVLVSYGSVAAFGMAYNFCYGSRLLRYPYSDSLLRHLAEHISQAGRLALVVYGVDCISVILTTLGFSFPHVDSLTTTLAKVVFLLWTGYRVSVLKRYLLGRLISSQPDKLGILSMFDRLLDGGIYASTLMFLLDLLHVELGAGFKSVFAFGSLWTLVMGLASKDLASMLVSGMALTTSNRFNVGDNVRFGDGTTGILENLGWMQSTIRHFDEYIEVIPNSHLGNQRVQNVSRTTKCRVKQVLRFRYEDGERLEAFLPTIIAEIKKDCPALITDGSRPCRAYWSCYKEDHLEVIVDVHFNLKPVGAKFCRNRQQVNAAIFRAVQNSDLEFVTTFYPQPIKNGRRR